MMYLCLVYSVTLTASLARKTIGNGKCYLKQVFFEDRNAGQWEAPLPPIVKSRLPPVGQTQITQTSPVVLSQQKADEHKTLLLVHLKYFTNVGNKQQSKVRIYC